MEAPHPPPTAEADAARPARAVERVRSLARILDAAVRIPGTSVRFGADALLGLIPGAGDVAGALLSGSVVVTAARLGAPPSLLVRMLANLAIDALVGTVPLLGDLFDVAWKANLRNVRLLEQHVDDPEAVRRGSRARVLGAILGVAGVLGLLVAVLIWAARGLAGLLVGGG